MVADRSSPGRREFRVTGRVTRACLVGALIWWFYLIVFSGLGILGGRGPMMDVAILGIACIASLGCLVALGSSPSTARRITLAVVSTMTTLLFVEAMIALYVALFPPITDRAAYAQSLGVPFDARTKRQVIDQLRGDGIPAVPYYHICRWLRTRDTRSGPPLLPLAGVSNSPTIWGNEAGEYPIYQTDRHGFNNPRDLWQRPDLDMALVGDSFAGGAYVVPSENIVGVLQRAGLTAINLGTGCMGPLSTLAILKEYAASLRPAVVVWAYFEGNDLSDLQFEREVPELLRYLDEGYAQGLMSRQAEVDFAVRRFLDRERRLVEGYERADEHERARMINSLLPRVLRLSHLRNIREHIGSYTLDPYYQPPEVGPDVEFFGQVLAEARKATQAWGGELRFLYLGAYDRYSLAEVPPNYYSRDDVLLEVSRLGIPVIDGHSEFSRSADALSLFPLGLSGHYTAEGYGIVADAILRASQEHP